MALQHLQGLQNHYYCYIVFTVLGKKKGVCLGFAEHCDIKAMVPIILIVLEILKSKDNPIAKMFL